MGLIGILSLRKVNLISLFHIQDLFFFHLVCIVLRVHTV